MTIKQKKAGIHSGVQKRILDLIRLALLLLATIHLIYSSSCSSHNVQVVTFFGTVECLFCLLYLLHSEIEYS